MIDTFCILVSTGLCVYVAIRAIMLDRLLPWFGPAPDGGTAPSPSDHPPEPAGPRQGGWRNRAGRRPAR